MRQSSALLLVTVFALAITNISSKAIEETDGKNGMGSTRYTCNMCHMLAVEILRFTKQRKSEEYIIEAMDHICEFLGPLENQCQTFVRLMIYNVLEQRSPDMVCHEQGCCKKKHIGEIYN